MNYVKDDNPAGRLYFILKKAAQCADSIKVQEVWREALDAKDLTEPDFYKRIIMMQELVQEVKDRVNSIDSLNHKMLLKKYNNIERATSTLNLMAPWKGQKAMLDEATLNSLEFCSEELSRYKTEEKIDNDTLVAFDREINEIINKLHNDKDLDDEIKVLLIDQLNLILQSVQEYRLRGAIGLKDSLAMFYGHFLMRQDLFTPVKDNKTLKETLSLVVRITETATKVLKFGEIAYNSIKQLL